MTKLHLHLIPTDSEHEMSGLWSRYSSNLGL